MCRALPVRGTGEYGAEAPKLINLILGLQYQLRPPDKLGQPYCRAISVRRGLWRLRPC